MALPQFKHTTGSLDTSQSFDSIPELLYGPFCTMLPDRLEKFQEPGKDIFFPGTESEAINCPLGKLGGRYFSVEGFTSV